MEWCFSSRTLLVVWTSATFLLGHLSIPASSWTVRNPEILTADIVRFPEETKKDGGVHQETTESPRTFLSAADAADIYGFWKQDSPNEVHERYYVTRPSYPTRFTKRPPNYRPLYPVHPTLIKRYQRPEFSGSSLGYWYGRPPPPRDYPRPSGSRPAPSRYDYSRYPPRYPDFPTRYIVEKLESYLRKPCYGPQCHHRRKGHVKMHWDKVPYPKKSYYTVPMRKYPFRPPHYFAYEDYDGAESSTTQQKAKSSPYHNYGKQYKKRYYTYYYPYSAKYGYGPLPPYTD